MTPDRTVHGRKDRSRIDVEDRREIEYVRHQFPWFSEKEILDAIKSTGPDRDRVISFLNEKSNLGKHAKK